MRLLGNIIWIIGGGFVMALEYLLSGFALCCTIIGIPFGLQVMKLGMLALFPFGQTTIVEGDSRGCISILMNILWFFFGIGIALSYLGFGLLFCITIIGIPFGIQHFKLMKVALCPFGRIIVSED